MTVTPTYPGVYIREIPSGSRTITGVATSITAFIGRPARPGRRAGSARQLRRLRADVRRPVARQRPRLRGARLLHSTAAAPRSSSGWCTTGRTIRTPRRARAQRARVTLPTGAAALVLRGDRAGCLGQRPRGRRQHPGRRRRRRHRAAQGVAAPDLFNLVVREGPARTRRPRPTSTSRSAPARGASTWSWPARRSSALDGGLPARPRGRLAGLYAVAHSTPAGLRLVATDVARWADGSRRRSNHPDRTRKPSITAAATQRVAVDALFTLVLTTPRGTVEHVPVRHRRAPGRGGSTPCLATRCWRTSRCRCTADRPARTRTSPPPPTGSTVGRRRRPVPAATDYLGSAERQDRHARPAQGRPVHHPLPPADRPGRRPARQRCGRDALAFCTSAAPS